MGDCYLSIFRSKLFLYNVGYYIIILALHFKYFFSCLSECRMIAIVMFKCFFNDGTGKPLYINNDEFLHCLS